MWTDQTKKIVIAVGTLAALLIGSDSYSQKVSPTNTMPTNSTLLNGASLTNTNYISFKPGEKKTILLSGVATDAKLRLVSVPRYKVVKATELRGAVLRMGALASDKSGVYCSVQVPFGAPTGRYQFQQLNLKGGSWGLVPSLPQIIVVRVNSVTGMHVPTVTSPSAGATVYYGQRFNIAWSGFYAGSVKISLYRGTSSQGDIVASTGNDGEHIWTVPSSMEANDYVIKITNTADLNEYAFSAPFSIAQQTGAARVTTPASGAVWHVKETETIEWSGFSGATVNIRLYRGVYTAGTIASGTPNDGRHTYTVPSIMSSSDYHVTIHSVENSNEHANSADFTIEPEIQHGSVLTPSGGEVYYPKDTIDISWTGFAGANAKIDLYKTGASAGEIAHTTPNDGSHYWTIPDVYVKRARNDYKIIVRDLDNVGQRADTPTFEIRNPPQATQVSSPQAGSTFVHHDQMRISWSGFTASSVVVELQRGNVYPMKIAESTPNDGELTWTIPSTPTLTNASDYKVLVYNLDTMEFASTGDITINAN